MKIGFRQVSPDKTHFNQKGLFFSMAMFTLSLSLLVENFSLWEAKMYTDGFLSLRSSESDVELRHKRSLSCVITILSLSHF